MLSKIWNAAALIDFRKMKKTKIAPADVRRPQANGGST